MQSIICSTNKNAKVLQGFCERKKKENEKKHVGAACKLYKVFKDQS